MKGVKVVRFEGLDQYDIFMQNFLYENTRLFAFHNKRDLSIDEHHELEYGFYKGVLFHDSSKESVEPYYFQEKNVFRLSQNGYNAILYYINYGDNYKSSDTYKSVSFHRLDCRTKESNCFSKREFKLSDSQSVDGFFRTLTFEGIDERYAFLSFYLGLERTKYYYVVDSLTGEWLPIVPDVLLNDLEFFSILGNSLSNYIVIKTGQYLSQEKERWWANNQTDQVDEHIIVIKDQEFIESVRRGTLNLRPYIIDSCTNHCALSGYIFDSNEIVYNTNHFDSSTTLITRYNPLTFNKEKFIFSGVHPNILDINNNYYSVISEGEKQIIYDLYAKKDIATIQYPDRFIWLDGDCLLTQTFISNGDTRLTSKKLSINKDEILGEGICFVDVDRDIVTILLRDER